MTKICYEFISSIFTNEDTYAPDPVPLLVEGNFWQHVEIHNQDTLSAVNIMLVNRTASSDKVYLRMMKEAKNETF